MSAVKAHTSKILNWLQNERKIDTYVKKNLLQPDFCPQVFFFTVTFQAFQPFLILDEILEFNIQIFYWMTFQ